MRVRNNRGLALACWLVAGLPILVSSFQAMFALLGVDAQSVPVIGALKQAAASIEVFDMAGTVFRDNDTTVLALFVLTFVSWLGVGAGMLMLRDRQLTYAAAGLVTVFFALFLTVYSTLYQSGVALMQLVFFTAIPFLTVGAVWASVVTYDWEETIKQDISSVLTDVRGLVDDAESEFEERLGGEVDATTTEWLEQTAPQVASEFTQERQRFRNQCQEISRQADQIADDRTDASENQLREAMELKKEARSLDPTTQSEQILTALRNGLSQELGETYSEITVRSQYGREYEIRNMSDFNMISLPSIEAPPVQIGGDVHELGERLVAALDSGAPVASVVQAAHRADQHVSDLRAEISKREAEFQQRVKEANSELASAREALSRIEGDAEKRLVEMLFEKRFGDEPNPPFPTEPDLQKEIETAKRQLHQCRFDSAVRTIDGVLKDAQQVKQIAIFFSDSVVPTIEHGSGSIQIPPEVSKELIVAIKEELSYTYDAELAHNGDSLVVEDSEGWKPETDPNEPEKPAEDTEKWQSTSEQSTSSEDVMYLLRELRRIAADVETHNTLRIQLGEYHEKFSSPELIEELESFCQRQIQVESVASPAEAPGYFELVINDEASARHVMDTLCERYREQYA